MWGRCEKTNFVFDCQAQQRARRSHLKVFQQLAELRRTDVIRSGSFQLGVVGETVFSYIRQLRSGLGYLIMVDLRKNGLLESHPRAYSLSSLHLKGTGAVLFGSVSLYKSKNGGQVLALPNATIDLTASIVLRESEAVVIKFPL